MSALRVPLTGSYNTRIPEAGALTSSSGVVGTGIVGSMIVGLAYRGSDKDTRYVNCLVTTISDVITGTKRLYVVKRPGFVVNTTPAAGSIGTAIHVWVAKGSGSDVISAFGSTNSTIYNGTTSLGAITGKANGITETVLAGTATLVISSTDSTAWYYPNGGSLTKIADADFPGNAGKTTVGTFAHLDGYAFIMTSDGLIYNSDLNSVTAWTANNFLSANEYPDTGVGLIRFRNTIVAFGKESLEVYKNAGNAAGSPLTRLPEYSQLIGCISADAITSIKDTVFFCGSTKQGVISLYAYDGQKATPVSPPEISAQLTIAGPSNVTITSMGFYGRHFVVCQASNTTFVYCIEENGWHEWTSTEPLWYKADGVVNGTTMVCYTVSNVSTSGKVFVFNPAATSYQDNGAAFTATIQTSKLDLGNSLRKSWGKMNIVGDQVTSTSSLGITWSDDDYQNYATVQTVDMSGSHPNLSRTGSSRRRNWVLTHSGNTSMRLEALDFPDIQLGDI